MSVEVEKAMQQRAKLLVKLPMTEVRWQDYAEVIENSEPWDPIQFPDDHKWFLIKDVPLAAFSEISVKEIADVEDPQERKEHRKRYAYIKKILKAGEQMWPVIVGSNGMVIDGFHRIAAMRDVKRPTVDVLYVPL